MEQVNGRFKQNLIRSNKQIKEERAVVIARMAETSYRRYIEDLRSNYDDMVVEREAKLDLSPDTITSLIPAKTFNATEFMMQDRNYGLKLRELGIEIDVMEKRYTELFGEIPAVMREPDVKLIPES